MTKKKKRKKPGPKGPTIVIDWIEFDKLCHIQCTQQEIADWFRCSPDTIDRAVKREKHMNFAEYFARKKGTGKISLRRKMWQIALNGDRTMLIWLSKNYLGMTDSYDTEHSHNGKVMLSYKIDDLPKSK